jgi:hypothetical protein
VTLQFLFLFVESWNKVATFTQFANWRARPANHCKDRLPAVLHVSARVDLQGAVRVYLAGYVVMADQHTML